MGIEKEVWGLWAWNTKTESHVEVRRYHFETAECFPGKPRKSWSKIKRAWAAGIDEKDGGTEISSRAKIEKLAIWGEEFRKLSEKVGRKVAIIEAVDFGKIEWV